MTESAPPCSGTAVRAAAIGVGAALTVAIPVAFPADGGPTGFDSALSARIEETVSPALGPWLVAPSNGPVVVALLLAACAWFALHRRWWQAVTMAVVPGLAVAVNTWVLKPLWDRPLDDHLAYPSGHTVHLVAVATAFASLIDDLRARMVVAALTVLALLAILPGMVERGYHHPTDVLGGAAAAVSMTIGACWLARTVAGKSA